MSDQEYRAEIERLREGLLACATISGEDISDGIPTWPDIVTWATRAVQQLRTDYDEALTEIP